MDRSKEGIETYSLVPLEKNHPAPLVSGSQIIPSVVKFDGRNDISYKFTLVLNTNELRDWVRIILPSVISSTSPLSPKHLD